jgi:hypothetical protein
MLVFSRAATERNEATVSIKNFLNVYPMPRKK